MEQIQITVSKPSSEDNTNVLKVDNLSVTRSGKLILKDVNLEIKRGEFVGLVGEFAFAEDFGVEVDQSLKVDGDGGKDFLQFPKVGKIDVKAAQIPNNLLVEEGHVRADVFVLYGFDINKETAWSVGWTYKEEVLAKTPQAWPQKVVNHIVPKFELNHINKLKQMLGIECEYDIFQELGL